MAGSNERRRPQLSDEAAAYVRNLIMSGRLLPGSSVRPEVIGEALSISSTPAREALQALRVEGFLDLVPRRGFLVAQLDGDDIRDIFHVQALIAGELAARCAAKAEAADIVELEALHHEVIAAATRGDGELLETKNHAFHREINLLADSRKTSWALGLISRYVPDQFYSTIPGWPKATVDDHEAILATIKAKDQAAARTAMEEHLTHAGELLAAHFDERIAARPGPHADVNV